MRVGPNLFGVVGNKLGAVRGFEYSEAMRALGAEGAIWDHERLDAFLENPKGTISGTKMNFIGIESANDRRELIAFLETIGDEEGALIGDPVLPAEILAIKGDVDYGEYLSSTCLTCHKIDGTESNIPDIIGWPEEQFVTTMHAYKNKDRDNPVMQQFAGALSDEEIAALAAYFAQIAQ